MSEIKQSAREVTVAIEVAMRAQYAAPEWALMMGVGNATGFGCKGWADAIAMSLWPSRGLALHGFEFKASRGDWKKELKNPEKAEKIAKYCDYWFLVCPPGIYEGQEVPLNWGVLELSARGLRTKVQAVRLSPEPLDRAFLAAMLRRASEADAAVIGAQVRAGVDAERERYAKQLEDQRKRDARKLIELQAKVAEFREKTGIDFESWRPVDDTAAAIKLAMSVGYSGLAQAVDDVARAAEGFARSARLILDAKASERAEA